jgi:lysine 6-dehydrogenase
MAAPTFAILGAGMQGTCAAFDLLRAGAREVRLVDVDAEVARRAAARVEKLAGKGKAVGFGADARDPKTLGPVLSGCDALMSAVPYFLNPPVAAACVDAGVGYVDLGGNTEVSGKVLALDARAKAKGVTLVPDCGLAPGLGNTLGAACLERIPNVSEVRQYCGGLPQDPKPPFDYHIVFAMEGLLNEYSGFADVIRHRKLGRVPALDELVTIDFPGLGELEAAVTSGGTSSCPRTWEGQLDTYEYKTLRYPGHFGMFRAYRDAGLLGEDAIDVRGAGVKPRDVLAALLRPRLTDPGAKDLIALMVTAVGNDGGKRIEGRWTLLDRFDDATGFSAMERCTAFPAAVVLWMIAAKETAVGAVPLETGVPSGRFLEHLAKRDLPLTWHVTA